MTDPRRPSRVLVVLVWVCFAIAAIAVAYLAFDAAQGNEWWAPVVIGSVGALILLGFGVRISTRSWRGPGLGASEMMHRRGPGGPRSG